MRGMLLCAAACFVAPVFLAPAASAQETVRFLCLAPAGHVCQFEVQTPAGPIDFALPSGERKEVAEVTPRSDTYCVCDPGPVTAVNSRIDPPADRFAEQ
jgi:hypothetical protein